MSWVETLQGMPAEVGGVRTRIDSISVRPGRRRAVQRFPGRDGVRVVDMGEDAPELQIVLECLGPDYMVQRQALETALTVPGSVTIRTGHRGEFEVMVLGRPDFREAEREGSIATITFLAVQLDRRRPQTVAPATGGQVVTKADELTAAAESDFARDFDTGSLPNALIDDAVADVASAASTLASVNGSIAAQIAGIEEVGAAASDLANQADSLVSSPSALASAVTASISETMAAARGVTESAISLPRALIAATRAIFALVMPSSGDTSTPARAQEEANRRAMEQLIWTVALAELSKTAVLIPYPSAQAAVEMRETLLADTDLVSVGADSEAYEAARELRQLTGKYLSEQVAELPSIRSYEPKADLPALVIAQTLYGDPRRAEEIVERNDIAHPGFCGRDPLEVLDV